VVEIAINRKDRIMPHYKDATPAKIGDVVVGPRENNQTLVGVVQQIMTGSDTCNMLVANATAIVEADGSRIVLPQPPANTFYCTCKEFTKVALWLFALAGLWLFAAAHCLAQVKTTDRDVSWKAKDEIARRGAMVERINGFQADADEAAELQAMLVEALAPPADDSNKWLLTLVTTKNCKYCEQLRGDLENAPALAPWVNAKDYTRSYFHYQVVQIEDASQAWRWKEFKPTKFPTLIVQPPVDGSWGDKQTVVMLKESYDGKPDKLAQDFRAALDRYMTKVRPQRAAWKSLHTVQLAQHVNSGGMEQTGAGGWTPPATPPPVLGPAPYTPTTIPPEPPILTLAQVQKAAPDADAKFWIEELEKTTPTRKKS
jgi:hypothetical protein